MKVFTVFLSLLILLLPFQSELLMAQDTENIRVAVFDFDGKGITQDEATTLTERFRSVLIETKKFTMVERQKVNLILEELGLQMTGVVSEKSLSEAGAMLGVERIVTGSIGKIEDTYTVDIRVVDVQSAKLLGSISRNTTGTKENLLALLERMAKNLAGIKVEVQKFPLKIFSSPGNGSIYLNGKYIGLSPIEVEVEEGVHEVRVTLDGHEEWSGKIVLNKPDKVVAKLEEETSSNTWLWIGGGLLVAGGGILVATMLGDQGDSPEQGDPIGEPPSPPAN